MSAELSRRPSRLTAARRAAPKLRPTAPARVRLRYLMQAWSVSLVVHVAILSALAAATFTSSDAIKKILNFDSALAWLPRRRAGGAADLRRPGQHPRATRRSATRMPATPGEPDHGRGAATATAMTAAA